MTATNKGKYVGYHDHRADDRRDDVDALAPFRATQHLPPSKILELARIIPAWNGSPHTGGSR